jgi:hypothetical protein
MGASTFSLRCWMLDNSGTMFVAVFLQVLADENTRRRLFRQFNAKLQNKKVTRCWAASAAAYNCQQKLGKQIAQH